MQIGSLRLESNLFLSPLAGYTNLPFRLVLRELGGVGLCTTDLINARSLLEKKPKALKLIETREADRPLSVQLFGAIPEQMRDAAQLVESLGYAAVDINMGCPVKKVCRVGGGSAMMTSIQNTVRLARMMVDAVKIPVTAKMRLGWDEQNITAPDLAKALEDAGIAAVFVHGRTRQQGFGGAVNLAGIRLVVQAVRHIPVIGNGDVTTPEAAKYMLEQTGCAGVSIGRGAFYNPWIFQQTRSYLETGIIQPEPSFEQRVQIMTKHLDYMIDVFGEKHACCMFRKIAPWYARCFGPAKMFTKKITQLESRAQFNEVLAEYRQWRQQFLDENGELLPKYRPASLHASFMSDASDCVELGHSRPIPTPKGPVDYW